MHYVGFCFSFSYFLPLYDPLSSLFIFAAPALESLKALFLYYRIVGEATLPEVVVLELRSWEMWCPV